MVHLMKRFGGNDHRNSAAAPIAFGSISKNNEYLSDEHVLDSIKEYLQTIGK
jgi:hypothetical protein